MDRALGAGHLAEAGRAAPAGHDGDLPGVRVFAAVERGERRERQVAPRRGAGVDDLVRDLGAALRAGDHVVAAQRVAPVAEAPLALAVQDQEHFRLAMVAVERALHLAGRQHGRASARRCGR
jgi:hypothetical protein